MSPRPRLFAPDAPPAAPRLTGGITCLMSLFEFYEQWFRPIVLKAERESSRATLASYGQSVEWWERLTGDPPLRQVNEFVIAQFAAGLREATYRRGLSGKPRKLARETQKKHLKNIRTILFRAGPTRDPNRPAKALLAKTPLVRVPSVPVVRKRSFTAAECLAIAGAAERMVRPSTPDVPARDWWRCWLALHFYTGQRTGTIRKLTWANVKRDERGQHWLHIAAEQVTKTDKAVRVIVHPQLLEAMQAMRRGTSPAEPLLSQPHTHKWLADLHERLQKLAGIADDKILSPHAWRRTHADALARIGLAAVTEICRQSLDHADGRTTTGHYVDLANKFRLRLPNLW